MWARRRAAAQGADPGRRHRAARPRPDPGLGRGPRALRGGRPADRRRAVSPFHIWTPDYAFKRLRWKPRHPLHVLVLRVYRIQRPVTVRVRPEYEGCMSWVEIDRDLPFEGTPVIADEEFERAAAGIDAIVREAGVLRRRGDRSPDRGTTGRSHDTVRGLGPRAGARHRRRRRRGRRARERRICAAGSARSRARRRHLGAAADRPRARAPGRPTRSSTRGSVAPGVLLAGPDTRTDDGARVRGVPHGRASRRSRRVLVDRRPRARARSPTASSRRPQRSASTCSCSWTSAATCSATGPSPGSPARCATR